MEMTSEMSDLINKVFYLIITTGIGALAWFIKTNFAEIKADISQGAADRAKDREDTDKKIAAMQRDLEAKLEAERQRNALSFEKVGSQISDLKDDLPFVYTTREDFIRFANGVDTKMGSIDAKIDKILENMPKRKGDQERDGS